MKISNFFGWVASAIPIVVVVAVASLVIGGIAYSVHQDSVSMEEKQKLLPIGTDVIVKGTDIRGTVTRWYINDEVDIKFA